MQIKDKEFEVYIRRAQIEEVLERVGRSISEDFKGKNPVFVCVLNGAFMFFGDLMKHVNVQGEVGFLKASSYVGMSTTGEVIFGQSEGLDLKGRDVLIVEDIVDTGTTLEALVQLMEKERPASLKVCTLLFKKEAYTKTLPIDYVCFETANKFLLGYGLDYDGIGRNLPEVYILKD